MKKLFSNIGIEKEVLALAAFIASYCIALVFGEFNQVLLDYSKLHISQASLDGIDVSARLRYYYQLLFFTPLTILIFYFVFLRIKAQLKLTRKDLRSLAIVSITGVLLQIADVIGVEQSRTLDLILYLFIVLWIVLIGGLKWKTLNYLLSIHYQVAVFSTAFILFIGLVFLFNSTNLVIEYAIEFLICIALFVFIVFHLIKRTFLLPIGRILTISMGICMTPLVVFLAVEAQFFFALKQGDFIPYKWLFIGVLFLIVLLVGIVNWRMKKSHSISYILDKMYIPFAFVSFLLLAFYTPYIEQSTELYELANPANSQMKIFNFNEIPFVDFMSSHMFSEQFYGLIYNAIFGYDGSLDFMTYRFLYTIIFFLIAYHFLSKVLEKPYLSAVFIALFPFINSLFSIHLFFGILVFFAFWKLIKKQSTFNYFSFFMLIIALIIWRLDTGVATLTTGAIMLPIAFVIEKSKIDFKALLFSIGSIAILGTLAVITAMLLRSPEYLLENFAKALHYVSAHQAHGYSVIAKEYNQQFYLLHVLFPLLAVLSVIYSVIRLRTHQDSEKVRYGLYASLFLFLLYLANFPRGIVRHGFMEKMDAFLISTFFIAGALLIISIYKVNKPVKKYLAFFTISLVMLITLKFFSLPQGSAKFEWAISQSSIFNLDSYFQKDHFHGRVLGDYRFKEKEYADIKDYMDRHLSADQTFLDFSNTPMLYHYCQRNVPAYFCQNLQNTVDDFLQLEHLKQINPTDVPLVVYSNYPPNWFDSTDGIPNAMRQYIIAEYIYKNYEALGIINEYSVFKAKGSKYSSDGLDKDTLVTKPMKYDYKKAGGLINHHFNIFNTNSLSPLSGPTKLINGRISLDENISNQSGVFLQLNLNAVEEGQMVEVGMYHKDILIGTVLFTCLQKELVYMLPISNQYLWHLYPPDLMKIKAGKETSIESLNFYKDNRYEYP